MSSMFKTTRTILLSGLMAGMLMLCAQTGYAQDAKADTLTTPFRKGRWLTGLNGTISSATSRLDSASNDLVSNRYSLELSTGIFVEDRWLMGLAFRAEKNGSKQFVERETESLFIGPVSSYYFMKGMTGSVFGSLSPGLVLIRDLTVIDQGGTITKELLVGQGFGLIGEVGYSFVIHDRIGFDLGLGVSSSWINATRESEPGGVTSKEKFQQGNVAFSFGFNVLLR